MSVDQREIDEVLEAIWVAREDNKTSIKNVKTICSGDATDEVDVERTLSELERLEMVKSHGDTVEFLASGEKHAEGVIRRHRLAERLFTDVLQVSDAAVELTACQFEHILSSEVVDSVCAFLGHPPLCPHGKAIPSGDCCKTYHKEELKPLIIRLADLEIGKDAEIAFITPSFHKRSIALLLSASLPVTLSKYTSENPLSLSVLARQNWLLKRSLRRRSM